jgi:glycosyltransferase involved in cell wall biosynthesis
MSEKALNESPYQISVINFDMDNPAPKALGSKPAGLPQGVNPAAINLIHLNAESIPLIFAFFDHALYENSYNIGYFFWELDKIPKCHLLALKMLDEIWVSSEYNREIYANYTSLPVINVGMAVEKLPVKPVADRRKFGLPESAFLFLTTFDSFSFIQRKNPLAAIESFQAAFPLGTEPAALVIKTQNRTKVDDPPQRRIWDKIDRHCAEDRRIIVLNETMAYADVLNLKKSCDCYLSLHRSEGWGFGLIESMQCGIPVIATAYGGNMDFCKEDNFFPVSYDLVEPIQTEYIYVERGSRWAQPHIKDAARQMRTVFNDQKLATQRAKRAREFVEKSFSVQPISSRYSARIREIKRMIGM